MNLEDKLIVGAKIRIGKEYSIHVSGELKENEVIELIEGYFDEDNGLYCYTSNAPSIFNEDTDEFESIYHLFGNDLENFLDCEIVS